MWMSTTCPSSQSPLPLPSYPQLISEVRDKLDTKSCFFHHELGPPVDSSTPLPRGCKQSSPNFSLLCLCLSLSLSLSLPLSFPLSLPLSLPPSLCLCLSLSVSLSLSFLSDQILYLSWFRGFIVLDVIRSSLKLKPVADGWMKVSPITAVLSHMTSLCRVIVVM